jgi:hypothetical protein
MLEAVTRTSFHHQPEAQHPKSSAIHKLGRPITPSFGEKRTSTGRQSRAGLVANDPQRSSRTGSNSLQWLLQRHELICEPCCSRNILTFIGGKKFARVGGCVVLIARWIPLVGFIAPMGLWLTALTAMGRDLDGRYANSPLKVVV